MVSDTHTNTHTHTQSAVTEPMWRLISWAVSKLKSVLCRHAKHNNSLLSLHFSLARGGKWGEKKRKKTTHEREERVGEEKEARLDNVLTPIAEKKEEKKRKRDAWLSDVWPIFRRSLSLLLSLISFLPLIYSKRSRLTQIHWRSCENAVPQELKHTYRNAHARRLADCTPRQTERTGLEMTNNLKFSARGVYGKFSVCVCLCVCVCVCVCVCC